METRSIRLNAQLVIGLIIIFIGLILTLDNLNILEARDYLRYWPVFAIVLGLSKTLQPRSSSERNAGILITIVGVVFLLNNTEVLRFRFRDYVPLVFVILGGSMIWRATARSRRSSAVSSGDSDSDVRLFAFMGGFEPTNNSQNFKGGELTAIMGGCEIDLRQASIKEGEAVMDIFAFWGGVGIKVPEDWSVTVQGIPIMGGIEDKTRPPKGGSNKRLIVKGYAIMGGAEITN